MDHNFLWGDAPNFAKNTIGRTKTCNHKYMIEQTRSYRRDQAQTHQTSPLTHAQAQSPLTSICCAFIAQQAPLYKQIYY